MLYSAVLYARRRRALVNELGIYNVPAVEQLPENQSKYYGQYSNSDENIDILKDMEKGINQSDLIFNIFNQIKELSKEEKEKGIESDDSYLDFMMAEEYYIIKEYQKAIDLLQPIYDNQLYKGWSLLLNTIYYKLLECYGNINNADQFMNYLTLLLSPNTTHDEQLVELTDYFLQILENPTVNPLTKGNWSLSNTKYDLDDDKPFITSCLLFPNAQGYCDDQYELTLLLRSSIPKDLEYESIEVFFSNNESITFNKNNVSFYIIY